jgi:GntR family transcriptional regulator, transcriptional repressor for pyruvate dehydrogenase complex
MVEVEVAGVAAERRSGTEVARIQRLLDAMYAAMDDADDYTKADIAFHEALIDAADNALLRQLMRPVNQVRSIGSILTIRRHPRGTADSMRGHQEIFDAITTGHAAAARAAMAPYRSIRARSARRHRAREPGLAGRFGPKRCRRCSTQRRGKR